MSLLLTEWVLELKDMLPNLGKSVPNVDDDSGKLIVLTAGSPTSPTVYSDGNGTVVSTTGGMAVLTFTDGRAKFYTANTVTSVDITGVTAGGRAFGLQSLAANANKIIPINSLNCFQLLAIPFGANDNSEQDTGLDLPAGCFLDMHSPLMRVTATDSTETIDFGILSSEANGDANGFIAAASVANSGMVVLLPQITGGSNIDYLGTNYVGALLTTTIAGADAVATVGGTTSKQYRTDGIAKSLSYTGSAGSDTAAGYFYLRYQKLPL